jgi:hypothetical protein
LRIDWAIPCRFVEVNEGLATMVGAGANIFTVPPLPQPVGFMIALRIVADEDDHADHVFGSQVLGPDMEPVGELISAEFNMGPVNPNKPAGWEQSLAVPTAVQFMAEEEGQYTVRLSVDDRSTTVAIVVQEART